jgi:antitoxin (DNA-binding transcriptional repressor) of toxin-antitoxin stability system
MLVNMLEAKNRLSSLVAAAEQGEEIELRGKGSESFANAFICDSVCK